MSTNTPTMAHAGLLCLAEEWTKCPPDYNCKPCETKFKPLPKNQIMTKKSNIHGTGVFLKTSKAIKADTVIALVTGNLKKRSHHNKTTHTIEVNNTYLEPQAPVKFVNHCCLPNSRFQKFGYDNGKKEKLALVSDIVIEPNQEITVNYNDCSRFIGTSKCECGKCQQNK